MANPSISQPGARSTPLAIEVWADIACPWCYIGARRLEQAIGIVSEERPDVGIIRAWRPFQLQPGIARRGVPWKEFVPKKFGPTSRADEMFAHVASVGAGVGLDLRFDRVATAPNTRDAHRLILWAATRALEWSMADALFRSYFTDGRDINDPGQLAAIAGEAGLDAGDAGTIVATREYGDDVDDSQGEAAANGISGVPFFVFDGRYAFSGAQPLDAMTTAIRRALREREPSVKPRAV